MNYIRIILSNGQKRLTTIEKVIEFAIKKTKASEEEIREIFKDKNNIHVFLNEMSWKDAFPCPCQGEGLKLDFDWEWKNSKKEIL